MGGAPAREPDCGGGGGQGVPVAAARGSPVGAAGSLGARAVLSPPRPGLWRGTPSGAWERPGGPPPPPARGGPGKGAGGLWDAGCPSASGLPAGGGSGAASRGRGAPRPPGCRASPGPRDSPQPAHQLGGAAHVAVPASALPAVRPRNFCRSEPLPGCEEQGRCADPGPGPPSRGSGPRAAAERWAPRPSAGGLQLEPLPAGARAERPDWKERGKVRTRRGLAP